MHCLTVKIEGYGDVYVNHNSDWSGDASISWEGISGQRRQVWIPGVLLLAIGKAAAHENLTNRLIAFLENLEAE